MVGMEVGVHDQVDIVGSEPDARKTGKKRVLGAHDRRHNFHQRAPTRLAMFDDRRVAPSIEQEISLTMANER
jgi:hypothetical protein